MSHSNIPSPRTPADWRRASEVVNRRASTFHELPAATLLLKKVENGARSAAYGMKANGAWLLAPSGAGKSRTLKASMESLLAQSDLDTDVPYVFITLLPSPTMHSLTRDLLQGLNYPFATCNNFSERANLLFEGLNTRRVRAVYIDEAHHLVEGNGQKNLRDIRNLLKRLLDETNICLVMSGLESLKTLRDSDAQLSSRLPACLSLKTALHEADGKVLADQLVNGSPIPFSEEARALLQLTTAQREAMNLREYCAVLDESVKVAALGDEAIVSEGAVRHAVAFVFLTGT